MTEPACRVTKKLLALIDETRRPYPVARTPDFLEQVNALEAEAIASNVPSSTIGLIRVVREITELAERITAREPRKRREENETADASDLSEDKVELEASARRQFLPRPVRSFGR